MLLVRARDSLRLLVENSLCLTLNNFDLLQRWSPFLAAKLRKKKKTPRNTLPKLAKQILCPTYRFYVLPILSVSFGLLLERRRVYILRDGCQELLFLSLTSRQRTSRSLTILRTVSYCVLQGQTGNIYIHLALSVLYYMALWVNAPGIFATTNQCGMPC